jgi:SAM-dependent methyltransferase
MDLSGALGQVVRWSASAKPFLEKAAEAAAEKAHVAGGLARALAITTHNRALGGLVMPAGTFRVSPDEATAIRDAVIRLYETDYRNVVRGLYPAAIAGAVPLSRLARALPRLALDAPRVRRRVRENRFDEVPAEAEGYPSYYRRTFHFQTDGYLGHGSAALYEAQVELLFGGTADVQRRQVVPPVVEFVRGLDEPTKARVLDVACGTGPVLRMLAAALPGTPLWGLDLSPHYVARARRALEGVVPLSLVVDDAAAMPFRDGSFDAVVNVYLTHELPADVRRQVFREIARVLRPGGLFVFADSAQAADVPGFARALDLFPEHFHEPYYRSYQREDLPARLDEAGFELERSEVHLFTKVLVARRR